jgi:hypothetical protein
MKTTVKNVDKIIRLVNYLKENNSIYSINYLKKVIWVKNILQSAELYKHIKWVCRLIKIENKRWWYRHRVILRDNYKEYLTKIIKDIIIDTKIQNILKILIR